LMSVAKKKEIKTEKTAGAQTVIDTPASTAHTTIIQANAVYKSFLIGTHHTAILKDISLNVVEGEFLIIFGPSGSGKSTLLNCLIGLEPISRGEITVEDKRLNLMDDDARAGMRINTFGVVYQQPIWVKSLTVVENVALPLMIRGSARNAAIRKAHTHLREVHMDRYAHRYPTEISGGEQQRVGLARSLINNPRILVLDEPTGNLDSKTADEMLLLLQGMNRSKGITIIMVTHNMAYLPMASKTIRLRDGEIEAVEVADNFLALRLHGPRSKDAEIPDKALEEKTPTEETITKEVPANEAPKEKMVRKVEVK
jgi:ABC-type lipoprotein export system ATPase subunit